MNAHRVGRDAQRTADLLVGHALHDQAQNLPLPGRKIVQFEIVVVNRIRFAGILRADYDDLPVQDIQDRAGDDLRMDRLADETVGPHRHDVLDRSVVVQHGYDHDRGKRPRLA